MANLTKTVTELKILHSLYLYVIFPSRRYGLYGDLVKCAFRHYAVKLVERCILDVNRLTK